MIKKRILLAVLILVFSTNLLAIDYLIEPYIGASRSEWDELGAAEHDSFVPIIGTKMALGYKNILGGIDYSMTRGDVENERTGTKNDYLGSYFGIFLAYKVTDPLRFSFTYNRRVNFEDRDGAEKGDEISGYGYALGVSYNFFKHLSLNLDYKHSKIDEFTDAETETESKLANKYEIDEVVVSISFPINF